MRRQQLKGAGEHAAGAIVRGAGSIRLLGAVCRVLIPPPLPPAAPAVSLLFALALAHFAPLPPVVCSCHILRGGCRCTWTVQVTVTAPKGAEIMGSIVCSRPARVLVSLASDSPSRVDRRKLRQVSGRALALHDADPSGQALLRAMSCTPTHARSHARTHARTQTQHAKGGRGGGGRGARIGFCFSAFVSWQSAPGDIRADTFAQHLTEERDKECRRWRR